MKQYLVRTLLQQVLISFITLSVVSAPVFAQETEVQTKDVSFETEDGWTIHGTYYAPLDVGQDSAPGLIVLGEPDTSPRFLGGNVSNAVAKLGMAALTVDPRGNAASYGEKDYQVFSPAEVDAIQLDVRAAVKFISSQKGVDSRRIGIFAPTGMAEFAAREAAVNADQIKALILSTAVLQDEGRKAIKFLKHLPVLAVVSYDDPRHIQEESAEPFFLSEAKGSHLMFGIDRGANIFNRQGKPTEQVTEWLSNNLIEIGTRIETSFKTEDGMTLWAMLYKPHGLAPNERVPGVVFVHGANHDATTWFHLAEEVTKTGLAALIFDQRGFRKSNLDDLRGEDQEVDAKAAVNFLASQPWVDSTRIGLMTATSRSGTTVNAAFGDPRIKTIAGLSFYGGTDETKKALANMDIPIFVVVSDQDMNADGGSLEAGSREAYGLSKNKDSMLLMYDLEGGRGSTMLKLNPELVGMLVRWFNEKLENDK